MKKQAFTLAETIMTLFIVGLVVTAAIPSMTTKSLSDNSKLKAYCATPADGDEKCTKYLESRKPFVPCNGSDTTCLYSQYPVTVPSPGSTLEPYIFNGNPVNFSLATTPNNSQDLWHYIKPASQKLFQVGSYFYEENGSSLYLTNNTKTPSGYDNNTVIGSLTGTADANIQGTITGNTVIGKNILKENQTKTNNIIIGTNNTIASTATVDNSIVFGDNNTVNYNRSIVIGSNNQTIADNSLLIGSKINQPADGGAAGTRVFAIGDKMYIDSDARDTLILDGDLEISNNTFDNLTFNLTSDLRLKNIKGSYDKGLKEILQLKPVAYYYKGDNNKNLQVGVIAQEVQQIFPEAVSKMPNGYYGVDDSPMFFAAINALKELDEKILTEEKRQENLNNELNKLERDLLELTTCRSNSIFDKIKCFIMRKIFDWRGM